MFWRHSVECRVHIERGDELGGWSSPQATARGKAHCMQPTASMAESLSEAQNPWWQGYNVLSNDDHKKASNHLSMVVTKQIVRD